MTKERVPNFPFADFVTETFGTELRVGGGNMRATDFDSRLFSRILAISRIPLQNKHLCFPVFSLRLYLNGASASPAVDSTAG